MFLGANKQQHTLLQWSLIFFHIIAKASFVWLILYHWDKTSHLMRVGILFLNVWMGIYACACVCV